ncbi:Calcineurin-like phosphoesterase [Geosmithia morbida]|uniref:Calcineurin-like phosphoesterase n=1 Tax=Geosmithia morbida TaxID=1094350 RepID=A0A9P4Z055_9HYPO|nr:Calcineurin-like phosphoesterase [Geosmithia morbida]KAF4124843.1 Calcineurin-like phosphoesterase [Geosmithia morbida]
MVVVAALLGRGLGILMPLAVACTIYLYLYPVFGGCAFPVPSGSASEAFDVTRRLHWPYAKANQQQQDGSYSGTKPAPFRLLSLGDPQLEGDSAIPTNINGYFPHVQDIAKRVAFKTWHPSLRDRLRMIVHDIVDLFFEDIPDIFESVRKRLDLVGNDLYLAHIYRTMHWWTQPTHVTVLGDLIGSQWVEDDEFERRGSRFWNRTFKGGQRLPDDLAQEPEDGHQVSGVLDGSDTEMVWTERILNVAGNHDIGYAGDLTEERMERFERVFGKANYELRFELPIPNPELESTMRNDETNVDSDRIQPEIRIIVLNDMNLDTPAKSAPLQDETYRFVNAIIGNSHPVEDKGGFTILLTHIPTYKPEGVCVDAPFFDFYPAEEGGGVREQYLLSSDASKGLYEGIMGVSGNTDASGGGLGRPGLILNGHDHAGCDTYHYINQTNGTDHTERAWEVTTWKDAQLRGIPNRKDRDIPGRREITVRSMMGDFHGNAGLVSLWFDWDRWEWQYEYSDCRLGRQHFWWLVHALDIIVVVAATLYAGITVAEANGVDVDGLLGKLLGSENPLAVSYGKKD